MADYTFETITSAQALAYTAADKLKINGTGVTAAQTSVVFVPGDVTTAETVSITVGGKTVVFGSTIEGETDITFGDSSFLYIGGPGADADPRPGGSGADAYFGHDGNDSFTGGDKGDLLQGNKGNDTLSGDAGNDTIYGGQGADLITTGDSQNVAQGNLGDDTITGGSASDAIYGGKDNDQINGGGGGDYLNGNLGDDSITGGVGNDQIFGEDGNDTIAGGASSAGLPNGARDLITGGAGADRFVFGASDSSTLAGSGDQILDWAADDVLAFTGAGAGTAPNYVESTQANYADALSYANTQIAAGTINFVAVQVGTDVVVFADSPSAGNGTAEIAVVLVGRTLADIDFGDIVV